MKQIMYIEVRNFIVATTKNIPNGPSKSDKISIQDLRYNSELGSGVTRNVCTRTKIFTM